jgi:hypothetical protein
LIVKFIFIGISNSTLKGWKLVGFADEIEVLGYGTATTTAAKIYAGLRSAVSRCAF